MCQVSAMLCLYLMLLTYFVSYRRKHSAKRKRFLPIVRS